MERILFKEEQRFGQWWIWLLLLSAFGISVGPVWYGFFSQVTTGQPWGDNPASDGALVLTASLTTLMMAGIFLLFKTMRLQVEILGNGLRFRYPPIIRKWRNIERTEIERYEVGKYRPVVDYGGWGIKRKLGRHGWAYNVKGNIGLKLFLKNGKTILLGSQREQALSYAMEKMMTGSVYNDKV